MANEREALKKLKTDANAAFVSAEGEINQITLDKDKNFQPKTLTADEVKSVEKLEAKKVAYQALTNLLRALEPGKSNADTISRLQNLLNENEKRFREAFGVDKNFPNGLTDYELLDNEQKATVRKFLALKNKCNAVVIQMAAVQTTIPQQTSAITNTASSLPDDQIKKFSQYYAQIKSLTEKRITSPSTGERIETDEVINALEAINNINYFFTAEGSKPEQRELPITITLTNGGNTEPLRFPKVLDYFKALRGDFEPIRTAGMTALGTIAENLESAQPENLTNDSTLQALQNISRIASLIQKIGNPNEINSAKQRAITAIKKYVDRCIEELGKKVANLDGYTNENLNSLHIMIDQYGDDKAKEISNNLIEEAKTKLLTAEQAISKQQEAVKELGNSNEIEKFAHLEAPEAIADPITESAPEANLEAVEALTKELDLQLEYKGKLMDLQLAYLNNAQEKIDEKIDAFCKAQKDYVKYRATLNPEKNEKDILDDLIKDHKEHFDDIENSLQELYIDSLHALADAYNVYADDPSSNIASERIDTARLALQNIVNAYKAIFNDSRDLVTVAKYLDEKAEPAIEVLRKAVNRSEDQGTPENSEPKQSKEELSIASAKEQISLEINEGLSEIIHSVVPIENIAQQIELLKIQVSLSIIDLGISNDIDTSSLNEFAEKQLQEGKEFIERQREVYKAANEKIPPVSLNEELNPSVEIEKPNAAEKIREDIRATLSLLAEAYATNKTDQIVKLQPELLQLEKDYVAEFLSNYKNLLKLQQLMFSPPVTSEEIKKAQELIKSILSANDNITDEEKMKQRANNDSLDKMKARAQLIVEYFEPIAFRDACNAFLEACNSYEKNRTSENQTRLDNSFKEFTNTFNLLTKKDVTISTKEGSGKAVDLYEKFNGRYETVVMSHFGISESSGERHSDNIKIIRPSSDQMPKTARNYQPASLTTFLIKNNNLRVKLDGIADKFKRNEDIISEIEQATTMLDELNDIKEKINAQEKIIYRQQQTTPEELANSARKLLQAFTGSMEQSKLIEPIEPSRRNSELPVREEDDIPLEITKLELSSDKYPGNNIEAFCKKLYRELDNILKKPIISADDINRVNKIELFMKIALEVDDFVSDIKTDSDSVIEKINQRFSRQIKDQSDQKELELFDKLNGQCDGYKRALVDAARSKSKISKDAVMHLQKDLREITGAIQGNVLDDEHRASLAKARKETLSALDNYLSGTSSAAHKAKRTIVRAHKKITAAIKGREPDKLSRDQLKELAKEYRDNNESTSSKNSDSRSSGLLKSQKN